MTDSEGVWPYWAVDLPGLSRPQAEELLGIAQQAGMSYGGTTVDPREFLTLHLDRDTVLTILWALNARLQNEPFDPAAVAGVADILREWIEQ